MKTARPRIGILGFDGVNSLDVTGPLEVFANAGRQDMASGESGSAYEILLIGLRSSAFATEPGVRMLPHTTLDEAPPLDTLVVPGGHGLRVPAVNAAVARWLRARAPRTRRVATVCTGIYGLAPTGLLDGRRVTTHWAFFDDVQQRFPTVHVDRQSIYVRDGRYWTSGGITAGIDCSLAMVEEDLGPRAALAVARELVVYLKRPGGQEQYSEPLRDQWRGADRFADLVAWITGHLGQDLSLEVLAARCGMSRRNFTRRFREALGSTPAEYVERLRLDAARERLTRRGQTVERVASSVGFASADVFRRRFRQRFGIAPKDYRAGFT